LDCGERRHGPEAAPLRSTTLSGTDFDLRIGETPMNFTGSPKVAITVNGSVPAPLLRWREGDTVTLRVANTLGEDASIHWHGILLPANMDGVPGLSFHGIRPGETYVYRFEVRQAGTYWYHSHSGFQEQRGLYGPLVIEPCEPSPFEYDREHVVMLTDWTDENPARVFAKLKKRSDYYNFNQRTVGDFVRDVRTHGLKEALANRRMWGEMRMNPTDLADVSGYTYTHLMNGTRPRTTGAALQIRRASATAVHQRIGDVVLRRPNSWLEDDRRGGGWPVRPPGHHRRVPDCARGDLRRHRRTVRSGRIHNLRAVHGSDGLRRWHPGRA
jgi:CopA family copper-resistance protein